MRTAYLFRFGKLIMEYEDNTVLRLVCKPEEKEIDGGEMDNRNAFSDAVMEQVNEYLSGKRRRFTFAYRLEGTAFQKKVWGALIQIPYGETRTYKQLAEMIGNPNASRAVGMANNKNPLHMIVPCHRVIGADGSLTGYAGGLSMKAYLLDLEKRNSE